MAIQSGLNNYFAWSKEVTWGTAVTPTNFVPFREQTMTSSIDLETLVSSGIIAGNLVPATTQTTFGATTIEGTVMLDLPREGAAELLEFCFGTDVTTGSDPYTHTYAMAADLPSFTCSIGLTDYGGTVRDFQFEGCKVSDFTLSVATGEFVTLDMTISSETVVVGSALTPSYGDIGLFAYHYAPFTIDAGAVCVSDFTANMSNGLMTDKTCLGQFTIDEQQTTTWRRGTVSATGVFEDTTEWDNYWNNTTVTLVLTATVGADVLTITAQGKYTPAFAPSMSGPDITGQVYEIDVFGDAADSDAALNVILVNNEA